MLYSCKKKIDEFIDLLAGHKLLAVAGVLLWCFIFGFAYIYYSVDIWKVHQLDAKRIKPESSGGPYSYFYDLPEACGPGDNNDDHYRSRIKVLENGTPLQRPHAPHKEIRNSGAGRYSHWDGFLLFSSTDNSSPNSNNGVYEILYPEKKNPALALCCLILFLTGIIFFAVWCFSSVDIDESNSVFTAIEIIIEPAHKLKIDQNKLQNCRSNILNLVNVL